MRRGDEIVLLHVLQHQAVHVTETTGAPPVDLLPVAAPLQPEEAVQQAHDLITERFRDHTRDLLPQPTVHVVMVNSLQKRVTSNFVNSLGQNFQSVFMPRIGFSTQPACCCSCVRSIHCYCCSIKLSEKLAGNTLLLFDNTYWPRTFEKMRSPRLQRTR